jgi:glutamyl-tRNA synthetase
VLRIEDLDGPRTVAHAVGGNVRELRWLGLDWDEGPDVGGPTGPYRQSERGERYQAALARLQAAGRVAECFLSRRDLVGVASAPHGAPGPVYGARARAENAAVAATRRAAGRRPSLRFRASGEVAFEDLLHGRLVVDLEREVGDVVVRRSDGLWAYALAVVVDDAEMGVTEVVRGDDLLPATGAQVAIAEALGIEPPRYLHVPLLLDADGARMAKRHGSRTVSALMRGGADPARLRGALLASAGLLDGPRPLSTSDVLEAFDPSALAPEPARWDEALDAFVRQP